MFLTGQLLPSRPLPSFFCGLMASTSLCPSLQNIGILAENLDAPGIETLQERAFAYVEYILGYVIRAIQVRPTVVHKQLQRHCQHPTSKEDTWVQEEISAIVSAGRQFVARSKLITIS
jgi:hypothetical protein